MNKLIFTAILSGFAGLYAMGQNEIRLMDMDLNKSYQTYGGAVKGKSVTNEPASIQGKTYDDVIGVQAKSHIKIDLHKNASRFQAQVGIADSHIDYTDKSLTVIPFVDGTKMYFDTRKNAKTFVGLEGKDGKVHPGSALFILKGDDKELYNSGIVKFGDAPKAIDIPLNGIKILDLIVEPTDDGPSGDHALWITPQIEYMEIIPSIISTSYQGKGPEVSSGTEKKLLDKIKRLPQQGLPLENTSFDWLLQPSRSKAGIYATPDGKSILLSNGMVARMFRVLPNLSTLLLLIAATAFALLTTACTDSSGYTYETVKNDPLKTRIYTLDNGLKVYMSVNKAEPRIETYIAVKVGGKNDPSETTGLAHYFEHLMFKGTQQFGTSNYEAEKPLLDQIEQLFEVYRKTTDDAERAAIYRQIDSISYEASKYAIPNEYDKLMSAIGALETNANTSMDRTVYIENIPSNQIENWARIQADRFKNVVIRGFHTELETIYEEKNMSLTDDNRKVYTTIGEVLYPNHPYGKQSVLGTQEHLKNPSITNVKNYHTQYYVPNNMAILLSGDFDPDQMIATIDKYFGDMQPNENIPQLAFEPEAPITKPIVKEVYGPDAANVTLAWRTDNAASDDAEYLLLASRILYNGQAGMIDLDLMQQQKVLDAFSYPDQRADYGALVLQGLPKAGQTLDEVRDLLLAEVAKLRNGEFSEELIKAVVNNLKVSTMREEETNVGRVEMYLSSFYNDIPWSDEVTKLDRIGSITKEQLVAWANEKLGTENYGIIYKRQGEDPSVQKIAKPALTPIQMNRDTQSAFLTEIQNSTVTPIEPVFVDFNRDMEIFKTDSGLEVLYKKNDINDLFSLTYLFDTGVLNDPALNNAFAYIDYLGTQAKTAAEIASELYDIACYYDLSASQNRCAITFKGLSENMGQVMDIFEDLVANAQGDEEILANYKADLLKKRADNKLNQEANFAALQRFAFFGGEAIQRTTLNNEQLEALTSDVLIGKVRDLLKKQHTILYYGPKDKAGLLADLKAHHQTPEVLEPLTRGNIAFQPTEQNKVCLANYNAPQLYFLQYSNLGKKFDVAVDPALKLYNEYNSGSMGAIVFQEMRESRSLAYMAFTEWINPSYLDDNYLFAAIIATQNDKMAQAIDAFDEIINNMPESEAAFKLAKEAVLTNLRTSRTIKDEVLWKYIANKDLGVTEDRNKAIFEKVQDMTFADLKAAQEQWIKDRKYTYCILGDLKDLDQDYLRKLGTVQIVSQKEMFGY